MANLPLHGGKAPRWLFQRMTRLARGISNVIIEEWGPEEMLVKLSDPFWFQSFGCVLGFDWHSSGLTTTTLGALKEGLRGREKELGIFICGGKGKTSRKTPDELRDWGDKLSLPNGTIEGLVYNSRMSAKVDNVALQDGHQIYHHNIVFTKGGVWAVIQQGMNEERRSARRYHWLSSRVSNLVEEPHSAICAQSKADVLDMTARDSRKSREMSSQLVSSDINALLKDLKTMSEKQLVKPKEVLDMPARHPIHRMDYNTSRLEKILLNAHEHNPHGFEELLAIKGVGPKTIRALALVSELIYGARASVRDPARFSFAHGGKDGYPYPVDRETYDQTVAVLEAGIKKSQLGSSEKFAALKRLHGTLNL
ncbi:MAG: DUF763 domain-containing protein [Candidatus Brocadiales bacterium]